MSESIIITDDVLAHYGVKGMKWGVRKDGKPQGHQGGDSSSKKKKKVEVSSDFTTSSGSRSVGLKRNRSRTSAPVRVDLSNDDMRKINERLRLENEMNRNLEELRKANMTRGQKARAHVGDVLLKSSKKAAATLLSGAMVDVGQKFMNRDKEDDSSSEKGKKPKGKKPKSKETKNQAYNDPPRQPNPKPKKPSTTSPKSQKTSTSSPKPKKPSTASSKPNHQQRAYSPSEPIRIPDLKVSTPRPKAKTTVSSVLEIQKKKSLLEIEGPKKKK